MSFETASSTNSLPKLARMPRRSPPDTIAADIEGAARLARLNAAVMWPKTRRDRNAASGGFPCRVYQFARRRSDWTLVAHWRELLASAIEWTDVRLFAEIELVVEGGAKKTHDVLVLKQGARFLWTFRQDDLEAATLSFVNVPHGQDMASCMLLDVRPMLADAHAAGFSYVVLFEREGHAGIIRNLLLRSWCSQQVMKSENHRSMPSGGQVAAAPQSADSDETTRGAGDETMSAGRAGDGWRAFLVDSREDDQENDDEKHGESALGPLWGPCPRAEDALEHDFALPTAPFAWAGADVSAAMLTLDDADDF